MEAYRDQYATLFNGGRNVAVIAVSVDADTTLASWARDSDFPVLFASDTGGVIGRRYGAFSERYKVDNRTLFVIGPDGKIAYKAAPFRELIPEAYTELAAVVDRLSPPRAEEH